METFIELKPFVNNPNYQERRKKVLAALDISIIDVPIIEIIKGFTRFPFCFTLQSCYGHFLHDKQKDPENINPLLTLDNISIVEYRIAYIAFCIKNNYNGKIFLTKLKEISAIDPEYIQVGCAEWFWKRQVNSYVIQVEPIRHKDKDRVFIGIQEALHIQKVRDRFFCEITNLIQYIL